MSQIELFAWNTMTETEVRDLCNKMRNSYYHIRSLRKGRFGGARLRAEYRKVAVWKNELLLCGVEKREVLDMIACYRQSCRARKQPFRYCKYCNQGRD